MFVPLFFLGILGFSSALECPAINASNISLPRLDPKVFSYKIQIIVTDMNKTLDGFEFYDFEKKAIFLGIDQTTNGTMDRKHIVYDFAYNQTFVIDEIDDNKTCTVMDLQNTTIANHQATLFGVGVENGPLGVTDAFYWNGNYTVSYVGEERLDDIGILTDHYQTCMNFTDSNWTYFIDVYFSTNWTMPAGQRAPVELKLNATDSNNVSRVYLYKFSDYHDSSTVEKDSTPQKPHEIICPGRKDAPAFFNYSKQFQFESEMRVTMEMNPPYLARLKEFFYYPNNLFRLDIDVPHLSASSSEVHDFSQGISYHINKTSGKCLITALPLNTSYFDYKRSTTNPKLVQMYDPEMYVSLFNFTFGGFVDYNGVEAQVWIATEPFETLDPYYQGEKAYHYDTHYISNDGQRMLLGIKSKVISVINSTLSRTTMVAGNVYNFATTVDHHAMDVSACYDESMQEKIVLKFGSDYIDRVRSNLTGFAVNLLDLTAKTANVSRVRVMLTATSFVPASSDTNGGDGIYYWITVFDVANVTGDSVEMVPQSDLKTALKNLQRVVNKTEFVVEFMAMGASVPVTADPDYWMTESQVYVPKEAPKPKPDPAPTPGPAAKGGWSNGAIAGLAIAMVIVGCIIGYLVKTWRSRKRSQYAYTMQE